MSKLSYAVSSIGYIGKFPIFPGTAASGIAALLWWFVPESNVIIQIILIVLVTMFGIFTSGKTAEYLHTKDPSEVVIDEVSGMWISLFLLPHQIYLFVIGFIIFRILDIWKPLWIDSVQNIPGGVGIMADDVLSGLVTCGLIHLGLMLL